MSLPIKTAVMISAPLLFLLIACTPPTPVPKNTATVKNTPYPEHVFWGDTHLHTANSVDAFSLGNRLDTEAALRFAMGERVSSTKGTSAQLSRPLDFLVISDHSEALGATKTLYEAPRLFLRDPLLRRWHDTMHASEDGGMTVYEELINMAQGDGLPESLSDTDKINKQTSKIWQAQNKVIDRYYQPGTFTPFIGYEYSPLPQGSNLHRVLMFRDNADKANKVIPFSSTESLDPEALWAWMQSYEMQTGGQVIAMPHNSNISNGLMFAMTRFDGSPITKAYADTRAKYEPVVEVTQIKGDSESHPFLSPNDEFASYGITGWDQCNLSCSVATTTKSFAGSYIREALKRGLDLEEQTGSNPYVFGLIGSTDSHTSLATADENNFYGKHSGVEISVPNRAAMPQNLSNRKGRFAWQYLASGYAAVWATSNTREAIFDAFRRREVYATTGPRISVRMFAGFDFTQADLGEALVATGYQKGVPMGGILSNNDNQIPQFLLSAIMDPESANLDRIQIVKGWIDQQGETHEKIYNVAWSDPQTRTINSQGKLSSVGNSVDLKTASWANNIGAVSLETHWQDPEFNAKQAAFYYARILEIPTPTWPVYDAAKHGSTLPADVIKIQQERAYTSPIWYKPNGA